MPIKPSELNLVEDAELLEWLARHVCVYSQIGNGRFGFDFNSTRLASESYYQDFRREIRDRMKRGN